MPPDRTGTYEASATFELAGGGPRFVLTHKPARVAERGTVIMAPALAEEMNKCRRMAAQTARALAGDGWRVVWTDLYGCGDSAGNFSDATWQQWVADLERMIHAHHVTGELWLWGVRAGALLVPPLLAASPAANLLLWQPTPDGSVALNQFLRLRASAALLDGDRSADRKSLRQQLSRGQPVEVAGYLLSPAIADGLAEAYLQLPPNFAGRIVWLDVVNDAGESMSAAAQKVINSWRAAGHAVEFESVVGAQFWQTVEITEAPALVERTRFALNRTRSPTSASPPTATR